MNKEDVGREKEKEKKIKSFYYWINQDDTRDGLYKKYIERTKGKTVTKRKRGTPGDAVGHKKANTFSSMTVKYIIAI